MCQKVVGTFNRLYLGMSVVELCEKGKVRLSQFRLERDGACINFVLVWEVFGLQVQARGLYHGYQPAKGDCQDHGGRIGYNEGRDRDLTG